MKSLRRHWFLAIAGLFTIAAAAIAIAYLGLPHANLRVTTDPVGSSGRHLIAAFASVVRAQHPRVHLTVVQEPDLIASSKALEQGRTDLAIVRSDVSPPTNGQTIAIMRRDVVAIVLAPHSSDDKVPNLDGHTVAIPASPHQDYNAKALDTILSYYDIPAKNVKRVVVPVAQIGEAVQRKHVAAVFTVGPMGPGQVVDVVAAVAKATKGAPKILAIDEAQSIANRFPGFESFDVPEGAFRGRRRPTTP